MKDDEIEIPVQINGKTRAVIKISVEATKEEAIVAGKEAIADKLTGNIVKRNLRSEEDHKHCAKIGSANKESRGQILLAGI